jgi:hypothetical protein
MISKVNESGFVEVLNMEMVHGVNSNQDSWHKVRISVERNEIHTWVDGRPQRVVIDDTYTRPEGILTMISLDRYDYVVGHQRDEKEKEKTRALLSQGEPPYRIMRSTSQDSGQTRSEPVQTGEILFPPDKPIRELYTSRLLPLRDGTLLLFLWGRTEGEHREFEGRRYHIQPIHQIYTNLHPFQ